MMRCMKFDTKKNVLKNTGQAGISNDKTNNSYMNKDENFVYQGGDGRGSISPVFFFFS